MQRVEQNRFINQIRERVNLWREGGYKYVTKTTARLLEQWNAPERGRRLFFCQIEALETAIYLAEVAHKFNDQWIANELQKFNHAANPLLSRIAIKMATGSGKTVVMAMLIAWQTLNKLANPQDARFSDSFLIVTPGITIRDRLRVLLPNDANNYYRALEIVPSHQLEQLGKAKIVITNYHTFQLRERVAAGKLTKQILTKGGVSPFTETPAQMVNRVCRELGSKRSIMVLNDEAHHCYRRKPLDLDDENEPLTGDDRKDAEQRNAEARVWISGLEAIQQKIGIKSVFDLSATPFYLSGSGYPEGSLFPWVVSDFSLIDDIESGIVKVPRVPFGVERLISPQFIGVDGGEGIVFLGLGGAQLASRVAGRRVDAVGDGRRLHRRVPRVASGVHQLPGMFPIVVERRIVIRLRFGHRQVSVPLRDHILIRLAFVREFVGILPFPTGDLGPLNPAVANVPAH